MDHTPTYPAEEAANLYAEATAALIDRFDIIDGLKIMTMLGAVESITALNEPPHKVGIAAIEAAQALVLRNPNVGGPLSVGDANAIVEALQIHLDLFLGQTAKPRRGAKEGVLARRVAQTLRVRHTSYPHHARRIHNAIWFQLERVGHTTLGMSLGQAGKLAQAAAYGVAVRLADSPVLGDIGKWMATGSGLFEEAWTGLFEIDMQVLAAVVRDVPRPALDALFDRLSVSPGDLAQANPDHLHLDNPIWRRPFVKFDGRLFCFTPQTLFWAQDEVLAELATSIWQQPAQNLGEARGAALERLLGETLTKMLPHAGVLTSSKWTDPRDGRGYETDAIVLIDGIVLILEAKGVALSAVARRGSNEWFKTFDDIVVQACVQATRLEELLRDGSTSELKLETDQGPVLLDKASIRHIVRIGVSLERVTMASFGLENLLRERIERASALPMPIVTIGDLWLVDELVGSEGRCLHYLLRRAEIEEDSMFVGDELDLIAWYLRSGFVGVDHPTDASESMSLYGLSDLLRFHIKSTPHYDPRHVLPRRTIPFWDRIIADKEDRRPGLWADIIYDMLNVPLLSQKGFLDDIVRMRRKIRRLKKGAADGVLMQRRDQRHPTIFACLVTRGLSDAEKIAVGRSTFSRLCDEHLEERVMVFHLDATIEQVRPTLVYYRGIAWDQDARAEPIEGVEIGSDLYFHRSGEMEP
ncbi:hypothetical protein [Sphingomonas sp. NFR15]|uniref:hypothetical protein n=1 Tax=Sphingomonas sp. NFR15 TaxID=1566282 RepID=UPI000B88C994|nr:hypothetical protein [Sphingomonas sp. NFR15]